MLLLRIVIVESVESSREEHFEDEIDAVRLPLEPDYHALLTHSHDSQYPVEESDDGFGVVVEGDTEVEEGEGDAEGLRGDHQKGTGDVCDRIALRLGLEGEEEGEGHVEELQGVIDREVAENFEREAVKEG